MGLFRNSVCRPKTVMLIPAFARMFQHLCFRFTNEQIKLKEVATEIPKHPREGGDQDDISGGLMLSFARNLMMAWAVLLFLTTPLYAQTFGALLEELSDGEGEQVESEMPAGLEGEPIESEGVSEPEGVSVYVPPPLSPKEEAKPLIPSSNDIQAAELENSLEEDDFAPVKNIVTNGVTLQGLDKQTARVFIIDAHVGQTIEFGTLKILVQHCEKAPLENRQESMAFIRITEQKANSDPQNLFSGWMLSSSPALSALDHPVYDVWVKECKVLD